MAISEDAIAIVASNLTAARCALAGQFRGPAEERAQTDDQMVDQLFGAYMQRLAKGSAAPTHPPSS